jgi:hypothetical protein
MNYKVSAAVLLAFLTGCVGLSTQDATRTQVVTFPSNADIEVNGKRLGEAPVLVTIPRDASGRVTQNTVIRAIPKTTNQFVQIREFSPGRTNPIPLRVMIDMRFAGTNTSEMAAQGELSQPGSQGPAAPHPLLSPRAQANQIVIGIPLH